MFCIISLASPKVLTLIGISFALKFVEMNAKVSKREQQVALLPVPMLLSTHVSYDTHSLLGSSRPWTLKQKGSCLEPTGKFSGKK